MRVAGRASGTIYAIADVEALHPTPLTAAIRDLADAGIRRIQVRAKRLSGGELFRQLEACCRVLEGSGAELWVDDRADLAALFPVAGVHVGQRDLPPALVRLVVGRRVVGPGIRIGLSTHGEEQFLAAAADPEVDLIAVGPVFPTTGKERPDAVVGVGFVRWARGRTDKTLVAIGGIDSSNVVEVLDAGADAAAVIGAICRKGDVKANALRLVAAAEQTGCGST
jgi:thiamine-phosphate pyrophosphorylase